MQQRNNEKHRESRLVCGTSDKNNTRVVCVARVAPFHNFDMFYKTFDI